MIYNWIHLRDISLHGGVALVMCWRRYWSLRMAYLSSQHSIQFGYVFALKISSPPNQYSIYEELTGLRLSRDRCRPAPSLSSVCLFHFTSLHFLCFIHFSAASLHSSSCLSSISLFCVYASHPPFLRYFHFS